MKNVIHFTPITILLLFALTFTACNDTVSPNLEHSDDLYVQDGMDPANVLENCVVSETFELKAGNGKGNNQTIAGSLSYTIENENIIVTFSPKAGWAITETHLYVSSDDSDLKRAGNGAPIPGHMPYTSSHDPAEEGDIVFTIPLSEAGITAGGPVYIVAHAVVGQVKNGTVKKTETAFAGDKKGNSKRWHWYISEIYEECEPPVQSVVRRVTRTSRW